MRQSGGQKAPNKGFRRPHQSLETEVQRLFLTGEFALVSNPLSWCGVTKNEDATPVLEEQHQARILKNLIVQFTFE